MNRMRTRATSGLVAMLLVGAMACGDDGDTDVGSPGSSGQDDASEVGDFGDPGGEASESEDDIDPCSLLEVSDIEAQFGELGTFAEGESLGPTCTWDLATRDDFSTDGMDLSVSTALSNRPIEAEFDDLRETSEDPVDIAGVGDDAFMASLGNSLRVLSGDHIMALNIVIEDSDIEGEQEKLEALAQLVIDRL